MKHRNLFTQTLIAAALSLTFQGATQAQGLSQPKSAATQQATSPTPAKMALFSNTGYWVAYNSTMNLSWYGTAHATYYQIYEDGNLLHDNIQTTYQPVTAKSLSHSYTVRACNVSACGEHSEPFRMFGYSSPNKPVDFAASTTTTTPGSQVTLSWTKPPGMTEIGNYVVSLNGQAVCDVPQGHWSNVQHSCSPTIPAYGQHTYKAQACNANFCSGEQSMVINAPQPTPAKMDLFSNTGYWVTEGNYINLSWYGTAHATYYKVYEDGVLLQDNINTTHFAVPAKLYEHSYTVQACNSTACGEQSNPWGMKGTRYPNAPAGFQASLPKVLATQSQKNTVTWTQSANAMNGTTYKVTAEQEGWSSRDICTVNGSATVGQAFACEDTTIPVNLTKNITYKIQACNPGEFCNSTSASPVQVITSDVLKEGHHIVSSQHHKYTEPGSYTNPAGITINDPVFDQLYLSYYSFTDMAIVNTNGLLAIEGKLDFGAYEFDMRSDHKAWLTPAVYSHSNVLAWSQKRHQYEYSDAVNPHASQFNGKFEVTNPNNSNENFEFPATGCAAGFAALDKVDKNTGHDAPYRIAIEKAQGNVYIPNFDRFTEYNGQSFTYTLDGPLTDRILKVNVDGIAHEWRIVDEKTQRWEMNRSFYDFTSGSHTINDRIWGNPDSPNNKPNTFGYLSEALTPSDTKMKDYNLNDFYYTEMTPGVTWSQIGSYSGGYWATNGIVGGKGFNPTEQNVGKNQTFYFQPTNLTPWKLSNPQTGTSTYSQLEPCTDSSNRATYCDQHVALNLKLPTQAQSTSVGLDHRYILENGQWKIEDENKPVIPEAKSFRQAIYMSGGHVYQDSRVNGVPETCRTRLHSFRRGHTYMYLGAVKDGKFENLVGVERVKEGDGYAYMSVIYMEANPSTPEQINNLHAFQWDPITNNPDKIFTAFVGSDFAIKWDDPVETSPSYYKVYQKIDDGKYVDIATITNTSHVINSDTPGTHQYKIRACNFIVDPANKDGGKKQCIPHADIAMDDADGPVTTVEVKYVTK